MDQGLTYQGSDTIDMQNKGTLVFHCYQILERWYVTDQTAILKLINFSALPEVLNISARIPFKQKLLLNVFFRKKSNNYLDSGSRTCAKISVNSSMNFSTCKRK
jgi:hypothetical protein